MPQTAIIDGSNLTAAPGGVYSIARLDAAARQVAELMGADWQTRLRVVVDASLRHRLTTDADRGRLAELVGDGRVEQTPAKVEADVFILRWADEHDALVISNDLFRPYTSQYPWLSYPGRCVAADFDRFSSRWAFVERYALGPVPRTLAELLSPPVYANASPMPPPGWYPDPLRRFDVRYWDGTRWSEHVARAGFQSVDPV